MSFNQLLMFIFMCTRLFIVYTLCVAFIFFFVFRFTLFNRANKIKKDKETLSLFLVPRLTHPLTLATYNTWKKKNLLEMTLWKEFHNQSPPPPPF